MPAIQADQQEVERLRQVLRTAPAARRAAVQDDLRGGHEPVGAGPRSPRLPDQGWRSPMSRRLIPMRDLGRQIQTLQESVPELRSAPASSPAVTPPPSGATGGLGSVHRLIGIYHARSSLDQLGESTKALERGIGSTCRPPGQACSRSWASSASSRPILLPAGRSPMVSDSSVDPAGAKQEAGGGGPVPGVKSRPSCIGLPEIFR